MRAKQGDSSPRVSPGPFLNPMVVPAAMDPQLDGRQVVKQHPERVKQVARGHVAEFDRGAVLSDPNVFNRHDLSGVKNTQRRIYTGSAFEESTWPQVLPIIGDRH